MTDSKQIAKYISIGAGIFMIILAICLLIGALSGSVSVVGETWRYEPDSYSEITHLEVEIGAGEIKFERGDRFLVVSNIKDVDISGGAKTVIKERHHTKADYEGAFFTVYIPETMSLTELDISTGAGIFNADSLSAEVIDFEFGAGQVDIGELYATREADIETGAGELNIGGGKIRDLQLSLGAGEVNIASEMSGRGELDLGVGEVNITLLGGQESYTVEVNKGIGDITINGESVSGNRTVGMGDTVVEINGGIGSVNIVFE